MPLIPRPSPLRFPAMRPSRLVIGFGIVLILLLLASTTTVIVQRHANDLDNARRGTANLAIALAEETSRSFESVDLVVRALVEQIQAQGITTPDEYMARMGNEAVYQMLHDRLAGLPQLDAITLIGADGTLINFSRSWPIPAVNLSDRDYFRALRDDPSMERFISEPVQNRGSGTWTIYLVRRINAPDGGFVGLVLGAMELGYFDRLYSQLALDPGSAIALLRRDGTLMVRHPPIAGSVGRTIGRTALLDELATRIAVTRDVHSSVDDVDRIISGRALADFPLAVTVSQSQESILAAWRLQAIYVSAGVAAVAIGLIAFIAILVRALERRERSEAALAGSEKRYAEKSAVLETTLEHMSQGIVMIGKDRRVPVYNRRAVEFLGLPPGVMHENVSFDEVLDYQWRVGEFGAEGRALDPTTRAFIRSGGVLDQPHHYERERPNGTVLEIRSVPLPDGGVVRTYTDITSFKRAEADLRAARDAAHEASRAKSDFLAMMSHEIRSPMNGVLGFVELLGDTALDEDQQHMVKLIHASATTLLGVINDVLDFSKVDAGAIEIVLEPVVLREFLPPQIEPLTLAAEHKSLTLACDIAAAVPDCVAVDPQRLWQILLNLLSNAIKFTERGVVRLEVGVIDGEEAGPQRLSFRVEDSGIGMDDAVLGRLFQPFTQADASTTKRFGGTGLGLSIAWRFAELMGGTITASSVPGKGSTFDLILPLATAPRPVAAPERAAAGKRDLRSAGPFRVLVAEDQATNRFLIQRQLAQLGVEADMAEDGRAALALYEQRPYALLITDCHMPEMDGIELTAQIRSREPAGAHLPIVGLTADVTPEISQRCRAAGMDELLTKPTRIGRLEEMLRALLLTSSGAERERAGPATDDIDFDSAMFDELFAGSEREGLDWLEQYLAAAEGLLDSIADHLADGDTAAVAAAAHRLAGISLSVGAHRLGRLCQRLEHSAEADSATPPPPMTEMRGALAGAAAAIGTLRQSHGAVESTS